ncbi:MAG: sulfatase [Verrucomicrobiaceae bacterium]|nr:sulfatase [Verrucomicrobiaceae bacterium]
MKRLLISALILSSLLDPCALLHAADSKRPNILFFFADDWGRYASIYQKVDGPGTMNDIIKTPNVDRVAREGVIFRNAHVCAPSCTPCRSALLSGQYFWRTRRAAILQGAIWDPAIPSYPLMLRDAGYHIGKSYKVWSPGSPADAPYGEQQHAYQKGGGDFNNFSENVTAAVEKGTPVEEAKQKILAQVRTNFDDFLKARQAGQPFCFWFGPTNTHRKWTRGSGKALWGIEPDSFKGRVPAFLPDVPEIREDLADYFGEAQAYDAAIGVMIEQLENAGELNNTLIAISGDHGAPGFTHGKCNLYDFGTGVALAVRGPGIKGGRVIDDYVNLMDLCPTFLEAGGVKPAPEMTGRSLMPVLLSDKDGLVDQSRTWVVTGRERHVESAREGFVGYPQRSFRTKEYLYIINFQPDRWPMGDPYHLDDATPPGHEELVENTHVTLQDMDSSPTKAWLVEHRNQPEWKKFFDYAFAKRPREELYILATDPQQIKNVAADPEYATIRESMNQRLMDELKRTADPRVIDGGKFFETPPMVGPLPKDSQRAGKKKQGAGRR